MNRVSVNSSVIHSVGYNDGVLEIKFRSGKVYKYFNVPEEVYLALITTPSVGSFFNSYIKGVYRFR